MKAQDTSVQIWLIISELVIGSILGIIFVKHSLDQDGLWSNNYFVGYIKFYGKLSLIFFLSVLSIGIVGAIKLKRINNIVRAIIYSIAFWKLSLVISLVLFNFLFIGSLYIILIGIIYGFNKGIQYNSKIETDNFSSGIL